MVLLLLLLFSPSIAIRVPSDSASSIQSSPYTGYQVTGPYPDLRVEGSWIVPTANCTATPNSVSNISVIIDGISGEGDAMEIGTYQDCANGIASYGAFVNIYPVTNYYGVTLENSSGTYTESSSTAALSSLVIHPGDIVEAQGTWRPSNTTGEPINWNTNFIDESTGIEVDTDAHTVSTYNPVLNSGAIILSSDGRTLTALDPIESGSQYTSVKFSDITGPQRANTSFGSTGNSSGYSLVALQMTGTVLGPLSSGGSSFQITSSAYPTLTTVSDNGVAPSPLLSSTLILMAAVAVIVVAAAFFVVATRRRAK
jgi:hypothetical protein